MILWTEFRQLSFHSFLRHLQKVLANIWILSLFEARTKQNMWELLTEYVRAVTSSYNTERKKWGNSTNALRLCIRMYFHYYFKQMAILWKDKWQEKCNHSSEIYFLAKLQVTFSVRSMRDHVVTHLRQFHRLKMLGS